MRHAHATCYMRHATCDMRHATCDVRHAKRRTVHKDFVGPGRCTGQLGDALACCMSHVACRMSHVACCMLHVACCMGRRSEPPPAAGCVHEAIRPPTAARRRGGKGCMLHVACCMSHVACCMLHVACCMSSSIIIPTFIPYLPDIDI